MSTAADPESTAQGFTVPQVDPQGGSPFAESARKREGDLHLPRGTLSPRSSSYIIFSPTRPSTLGRGGAGGREKVTALFLRVSASLRLSSSPPPAHERRGARALGRGGGRAAVNLCVLGVLRESLFSLLVRPGATGHALGGDAHRDGRHASALSPHVKRRRAPPTAGETPAATKDSSRTIELGATNHPTRDGPARTRNGTPQGKTGSPR